MQPFNGTKQPFNGIAKYETNTQRTYFPQENDKADAQRLATLIMVEIYAIALDWRFELQPFNGTKQPFNGTAKYETNTQRTYFPQENNKPGAMR